MLVLSMALSLQNSKYEIDNSLVSGDPKRHASMCHLMSVQARCCSTSRTSRRASLPLPYCCPNEAGAQLAALLSLLALAAFWEDTLLLLTVMYGWQEPLLEGGGIIATSNEVQRGLGR